MQLGEVSPFVEAFMVSKTVAALIYDIIDRKPLIDSTSEEGEKPSSLRGDIDFKDVKFSYPSRPDVEILKSLSFSVKKGQMACLCRSIWMWQINLHPTDSTIL